MLFYSKMWRKQRCAVPALQVTRIETRQQEIEDVIWCSPGVYGSEYKQKSVKHFCLNYCYRERQD